MAARKYTVYEGGGTVVDLVGDAGGFFRRMAILYPDYMDRSIRHGAYNAQMRLKVEFLQHAPGGQKFPDITPVQSYRAIDAFKKHRNRYGRDHGDGKRLRTVGKRAFLSRGRGLAWGMSGTQWPAGGKLAQAMGYSHKRGTMTASVGWLSKSAARLGAKFQQGDKERITPKMRGLFHAAGVIIGKKNEIITPARPVMVPFFRNRSKWILDTILKRLGTYINRDAANETRKFINRRLVPGRGWIAS